MAQEDMDITFITVHDLDPQATITFATPSIAQILGFWPSQIIGRSCFDYFHPDDVPLAQYVHNRNVHLDKAAVLHYARIRTASGGFVMCECVFTVVYNVLVACTSIYHGSSKNQRRAIQAPAVRRIFTSSPRDPRYHMLEHLSPKFRMTIPDRFEPRAALICSRFSRETPIMFSTDVIETFFGIAPEQLKETSFYDYIQQDCVEDAVRVIENAKANDSIAYMRFFYYNPFALEQDDAMREASQSEDSEEGGVRLTDYEMPTNTAISQHRDQTPSQHLHPRLFARNTSGQSIDDMDTNSVDNLFDSDLRDPTTTASTSRSLSSTDTKVNPLTSHDAPLELEAVISCSADGLVIVIRQARPLPPDEPQQAAPSSESPDILFAAPWAINPIQQHFYQPNQESPVQHGFEAPPLPAGPPQNAFLEAIRDVAVFAWALTGINGNISSYSHGQPLEGATPSHFPIWDPYGQGYPGYSGPSNQAAERWQRLGPSYEPQSSPYDRSSHVRRHATHRSSNGGAHAESRNTSRLGREQRNNLIQRQIDRYGQFTHYGDLQGRQWQLQQLPGQLQWSNLAASKDAKPFQFRGSKVKQEEL